MKFSVHTPIQKKSFIKTKLQQQLVSEIFMWIMWMKYMYDG